MARENQIRVAVLATIVAAFMTLSSADAAPAPTCAQIRSACEAAGFVRGGGKMGNGLHRHCIAPIMHGSLPPRRAAKPLPHIAASAVADCKAQRGAARNFMDSKTARKLPGEARQRLMQIAQRYIGRLRD
jgi:hypothetical protein